MSHTIMESDGLNVTECTVAGEFRLLQPINKQLYMRLRHPIISIKRGECSTQNNEMTAFNDQKDATVGQHYKGG